MKLAFHKMSFKELLNILKKPMSPKVDFIESKQQG